MEGSRDLRRSSRSNFGVPPVRFGEFAPVFSSTPLRVITTQEAGATANVIAEGAQEEQFSAASTPSTWTEFDQLANQVQSQLDRLSSMENTHCGGPFSYYEGGHGVINSVPALEGNSVVQRGQDAGSQENVDACGGAFYPDRVGCGLQAQANYAIGHPSYPDRVGCDGRIQQGNVTSEPNYVNGHLTLQHQMNRGTGRTDLMMNHQPYWTDGAVHPRAFPQQFVGGSARPGDQYGGLQQPQVYSGTERYFGGGAPLQPQTTVGNDIGALTNALVQALTLQAQSTERFVARQSQGSALPTFGGNPLDWPLFAHHFIQSTRDCGFTPAQNMARLDKALRGEARKAVRSLMIIPENTHAVMQTLERKYGRPEYVIHALVEIARKMPSPKDNKLSSIVDYAMAVNNLVTTVRTLNQPAHLENPSLLMELVDKLPDSLKLQWGKMVIMLGGRASLENFANWINHEADAVSMVTIPKFSLKESKEYNMMAGEDEKEEEEEDVHNTEQTKINQRPCPCCKNNHVLAACEEFKKMNVKARWDVIKKNNLCFRCMKGGHALKTCRSKSSCQVEGCSRRHHTLLHGNPPAQDTKEKDKVVGNDKGNQLTDVNATTVAVGSNYTGKALLRIIVVDLHGPKGKKTVNALLDGGSTATLIAKVLADDLGLDGESDPLRIRWTDGSLQNENNSKKVECFISPARENVKYKIRKVRTVEKLSLPPQRKDVLEIVKEYPHLQTQKFTILSGEKPLLLLGQEHFHLFVSRDIIEKDANSPILTKTKLGWVISGPTRGKQEDDDLNFMAHHESDDDIIHNLVKESCSLESIGIKTTNTMRSQEDEAAEEKMKLLTRRIDSGNRWETGFLWRNDGVKLPYSKDVALNRLLSVERKLRRNPELSIQYKEKMSHYLEAGYARKLTKEELDHPSEVEWYLPHFDQYHPNKPKKIRLVFDAASRSRGVCLNDYLLTGPDLLVSLPGLLVKFRQRSVAIGGDIAEMFHQVKIRKKDCAAQRFLWREKDTDDYPTTYQLEVMMFGSVCSPYCAQYVKNLNAFEFREEFPEAVRAIQESHYMDDWLQSVDTENEALKLALEVKEVHKRGGFQIGKWTSNSVKVLNELDEKQEEPLSKDLAHWSEVHTERVLGLHWIPEEDMFTYRVNLNRAGIGIATGEVMPTKRIVLRTVMLVWDPLGFLGHFLIKARILLQDIWRSKIGWDDTITDMQFKKWKAWIADLPRLPCIRIQRCYSGYASTSKNVQLHIFADSSELASCCIGYLRVEEENGVVVTMIMSKTRVAPVKPCSVPRLELTAALMASRLGKFLLSELDIKIHSTTYWTDSLTTIKWIRSETKKFQQFVAVRVGEIQESTDIHQWKWVPSSQNPADDGTRDGKVDLGRESRWWNGPAFLKSHPDCFPEEPKYSKRDEEEDAMEMKREFVGIAVEEQTFCLPETERFSNYMRLVRTVAWILRLIDRLKKRPVKKHLELEKAEFLLFKRSQWASYPSEMQILATGGPISKSSPLYQLSPMVDKTGVLRMDSRLVTAAEEGYRQPIILHSKDYLTGLLIEFYHRIFHHSGQDMLKNELRKRFWIPRATSAIRRVIRDCLFCKRRKAHAKPPLMAALPEFKTQPQSRPFNICGMDYFGPLDVTIGRRHEKRYGVLFTCMNTRAVHLEVAGSLTTDSCIMAIRRMIARRGHSSEIWSDNGTNMKGAEKELREALTELDQGRMNGELEVKGIKWHFIPPQAPHMGGSWERLVRSVKITMAVIMKERAPKEEILRTVFAEAEAIVNCRPLTDVPVDPESPEALTPFHFLIGTSSHVGPPGYFEERNLNLEKRWRQSQALADMFWKRWVREYLPTLQRRTKWHGRVPHIEKGDIVVVLDETLKRNTWPLGVVTDVFPGKDKIVRVVQVKTSTGIYKRPVVKLGKLDIRAAEPIKD